MRTVLSFIVKHKILSGIIGGIIILIFLSLYISQSTSQSSIATIKRENLINTVLVNGTYTVASQTQVNSPTNGIITKLYVTNGEMVKRGTPLFHVESSATVAEQKATYASYLAANSQLQADTADLYTLQSTMYAAWKKFTDLAKNSTYQNSNGSPNTTNRVLPEFTTAQDDWLAAEANYKNQKDVIAKDNASLASTKQGYDETQSVTVTAPASGKVINLAAKVNDQVAAPLPAAIQASQTDSTQSPNSPVLIIANFSNPIIVSAVDQVNIPRLAVGQKASIVFDALPNQTFSGSVDHIDAAGKGAAT